MAILKDENALVTRFLSELDVDYQSVRRMVEAELPTSKADFPRDEEDEGQSFSGHGKGQPSAPSSPKSSSDTPVLDNFGIDLTRIYFIVRIVNLIIMISSTVNSRESILFNQASMSM